MRNGAKASGERYELVFLAQSGVITRPLPRSGSVVLGRDEDADVCIPDPSVSRKHARLHLGPPLRIEDLGSRNGTRIVNRCSSDATAPLVDVKSAAVVGGRIDGSAGPVELVVGNDIHLGAARLVVQRCDADAASAPSADPYGPMVIATPAMRALYERASRIAKSSINVLILGETGVGKEMLATFLHRASPRASRAFLCLSCVSLSESLLESELFGHERGAFTGAVKEKPGLLEMASGGTVFLDEAGELPASTQAKLLRVIEDRKVTRVGGLHPKSIDVRFLAATNHDLEADVARGAFRRDLYFRLNGIALTIPPLRERLEEIEPLARRFAAKVAAEIAPGCAVTLSKGALNALMRHPWPGNVRELRNVMERAVVLAGGSVIDAEHLLLGASDASLGALPPGAARQDSARPPPPLAERESSAAALPPASAAMEHAPPRASTPLRDAMEAHERERIVHALDQCANNQTRAASLLGISRRTLVERVRTYGIPRPRRP